MKTSIFTYADINIREQEGSKMNSKHVVAQMPPEGYFMPDAKRHAKNRFFLRRNPHHSLWWDVADSAFLQPVETALVDSEIREHSRPRCSLPSCRDGHGLDVCHHHGAAQNQQDRDLAVQRGFSGDAGAHTFSRPIYLAAVLEALACQIYPPVGQASRQPEGLICSRFPTREAL